MRKWLAAPAFVIMALPAAAADLRLNPTTMTCRQVQSTIAQHGAVVLRYPSRSNPNLPIFDRYVANTSHCKYMQVMSRGVPTRDNPACPVRTCRQVTPQGDRGSPR